MSVNLPLRPYSLPAATVQLIGSMVLFAANIDNLLSHAVALLEAGPKQTFQDGHEGWMAPQRAYNITNIHPRISALKQLSGLRGDPALDHLVAEFRWAMSKVTKARNFITHGTILGDPPETFWSQRKLKQMTLAEVIGTAPKFSYAEKTINHIIWLLMEIEPPYALPDRP